MARSIAVPGVLSLSQEAVKRRVFRSVRRKIPDVLGIFKSSMTKMGSLPKSYCSELQKNVDRSQTHTRSPLFFRSLGQKIKEA